MSMSVVGSLIYTKVVHTANSVNIATTRIFHIIICLVIYIKKKITQDDIRLIATGPWSGFGKGVARDIKYNERYIKNKNIIVVDLAYNIESLDYLKREAKTVIVID